MNLSKIEGDPSSKWFIYQGYKGAGEKIKRFLSIIYVEWKRMKLFRMFLEKCTVER
ncbi:MAG: hypothetical protein KAR30_02205 [Gammaproteobacteria bacterium]|nr:hypothetical protein [Gammaproteobacteria bacterium]